MTSPHAIKGSRNRISETAIAKVIRIMQQQGLTVGKVSIDSGKVEIHCGGVDATERQKEDEGLEKW